MNIINTGIIIRDLRKARNLTQKQLADRLSVEAKTISKWETGKGLPDISYIPRLSDELGINAKELLEGKLEEKTKDSGNMKKTQFYLCPECQNFLTSTSSATVFCCSKKLAPLKIADDNLPISMEIIDNEYYISTNHQMSKENHLILFAIVKDDCMNIKRLYPEQAAEARFPRIKRGNLYIIDNHGNFYSYKIKDTKEGVLLY